ncbi:enoyl-CoA hydratase/isomerase family protein [Virgibacillus sp. W0430]|uniref:enoyl-CoA hydratase/isomerase family protein n=1 Tax=Virgibacillus sp. W0430 TaxID=3391580 RepID=UPI003F463779
MSALHERKRIEIPHSPLLSECPIYVRGFIPLLCMSELQQINAYTYYTKEIEMDKQIVYERTDAAYGQIFLNRPEKRNAISVRMIEELSHCLAAAKDDHIKFLLIRTTGGRIFSAGGDLNDFHGNLSEKEAFTLLTKMKNILFDIATFPVPTICLLNGDALGGGCELATACDFRIAKDTAKFGFIQTNLKIIPAWGGGALLYKKVHPTFAYQWIIEGNIFDAPTLKANGWLHNVIASSDWEDEEVLLGNYLNKTEMQCKLLKEQYIKSIQPKDLMEKMTEEVVNCAQLWNTKEHQEIVDQFFARKKGHQYT